MSLVLDSSATLAWIYSDETTDSIRALFDQVINEGAIVPALWRLEFANSLTVAVRRSRSMSSFAVPPSPIWRIWTSLRTSIPTATPGATRCIWPTASDSHFTTRPI